MRGYMGDWTYYSCLMRARDIATRVNYADEVHQNQALSDRIQRKLNAGRGRKISNYLQTNEDRFFNSLVIAVYDGDPTWHEFGDIKATSSRELANLSDDAKYTLGFLSLDGSERLFALDGQHRLSGIKQAVLKSDKVAEDELSVIFVGHSNTERGLIRTRKLFTTLNKTAKPVAKDDIILLDESDAMAITTRRLVEKGGLLQGERIAFEGQANIRPDDQTHITTIINLYDVVAAVLTKVDRFGSSAKLKLDRPSDNDLDKMLATSEKYFRALGSHIPAFGEFLSATDRGFSAVVARHRTNKGGNLLFRPFGQKIFVEVVAALRSRAGSLDAAVKQASRIPLDLQKEPYFHVLWDPARGIERKAVTHTRDMLLYMLGVGSANAATLRGRRAEFMGDKDAKLPARIR